MPVTDASAKARALYDARRRGVPIPPFTDADPALGTADGYAIPRELIDLLLADGDRLIGGPTAAVPVTPGDVVVVSVDRLGTLELACH